MRKRSLAKNNGVLFSKDLGDNKERIKKLVLDTQKNLNDKSYASALQNAQDIESLLKSIQTDDKQIIKIYLTCIIWQIRAKQGLNASKDEILSLCDHYYAESDKLNDSDRKAQALKIKAQCEVNDANWALAVDYLDDAIKEHMNVSNYAQAVPAMSDLAGMCVKLYRFIDAQDVLNTAMDILDVELSNHPSENLLRTQILNQYYEIYSMTGDMDSADNVISDIISVGMDNDCEDPAVAVSSFLSIFSQKIRECILSDANELLIYSVHFLNSNVKHLPELYDNQLNMIELSHAQLAWLKHEFKEARQIFDKLKNKKLTDSLKRALLLTEYQWAIETGLPGDDPQNAADALKSENIENFDMHEKLAVQLCDAELLIEHGHFDDALEIVEHVHESAGFLYLFPIATKAKMLKATILKHQAKYAQAIYLYEASLAEFVGYKYLIDLISTAVICQTMYLKHPGVCKMSKYEGELKKSLLSILDKTPKLVENFLTSAREEEHIEGLLDVGMAWMHKLLLEHHFAEFDKLENEIRPHVLPEKMAHRAMCFLRLCAIRHPENQSDMDTAKEIARQNKFYWAEEL